MRKLRFLRRSLGVRARTTLIATAVVGLALVVSGVLLVAATRSTLFESVEIVVSARATDVASQVADDSLPDSVPFIRGISVQVVVDGNVISSTENINGQGRITDDGVNSSGAVAVFQVPSLDANENEGEGQNEFGGEGPYLVAATAVGVEGKEATVYAAGSLGAIEDATRTLVPLLALGIPGITMLVGVTVWRLTRRAFSPVEAMAVQAETISYSDLHLRLTEPEPDDEIRHLAVRLNRMLERLEISVSQQRRFTADAGHELKSPVATLLTMAEVAELNPQNFEVAELAADVVGQSRRLAALVDDLLLLARVDEHRLDLSKTKFDLADVVEEEVAGRSSSTTTIDTSRLTPTVLSADRRRLGQVVRNLINNATRHTAHTVRVDTHATQGHITLCVADDGPGVPYADRERVFQRFVRLDDARSRETGGTGLGLSVVRSIVEAHGGRISVDQDSELGGAQFTVVLPTG